ncbi:MAG: hypothetical protein ACRDJ2_10380 [Actinomycetota bacterium]
MEYLNQLLAGYEAGLLVPDGKPLEELRRGIRGADSAEERGRCLAAIALALVNDIPASS